VNQKSYDKSQFGKLYLIPTPIGNLSDITYRAIETFKMVDIVYAEDTRETFNLLKYYDINKKIESCHKYSEMKHKDKIISILKSGKNIGYCTDRGTPLISDPGNVIVDEAIKEGISVIALPGPNALLPAINMSGISNQRFLFYGFLNSKKTLAKKELIDLKNIKQTLIFYESPYRIQDTLKLILEVFGNRKASIVREISKLHEEVLRSNIETLIKEVENIKGEIVLVIEGNNEIIEEEYDYQELVNNLIKKGYSKRDAIKEIANKYSINKNKLYNLVKE
jgi:16S rRNA (cytidine1402-2'-O)-methyltransferase